MNDKTLQKLEEKLGFNRIKINEFLSLHTTLQIGGPADFYFEAETINELMKAVQLAENLNLAFFILGSGSNILVSDKGFPGLIIKNKAKEIKILKVRGKIGPGISGAKTDIKEALIQADSGVPFNQLVRFTIEEGLGGIEGFLGLPGTVGGALACNAHWQDKKIEDFVVSRKIFKDKVLLSAVFNLKRENKELLWQRARRAIEYRQKSQPVGASAGCVFRNIKKSEAVRLGTTDFTTSTGFLIEAAGLKGTKIGRVQISPIHANFMINLGGAKASDVLKLINLVKEKVKGKFDIELKEEIVYLGEF